MPSYLEAHERFEREEPLLPATSAPALPALKRPPDKKTVALAVARVMVKPAVALGQFLYNSKEGSIVSLVVGPVYLAAGGFFWAHGDAAAPWFGTMGAALIVPWTIRGVLAAGRAFWRRVEWEVEVIQLEREEEDRALLP